MSARDTLAKAIYDNDCGIAAKIADDGMPLVPWGQFKRDNPESAAVTTAFAGVYLSALRAAGWEVVPQRATEAMQQAAFDAAVANLEKCGASGREGADEMNAAIWTAMLTAAAQETTDGP